MKAAKSEANAAIDDARRAQENEFQLLGSDDSAAKEAAAIASSAQNDVLVMEGLFQANKGTVSKSIVESVAHVSLELSETRVLAGKRISGQAI